MKKEADNILIDDYSYQKSLKSKKSMPALNFHYLMGLKRDVPNYSNNSSYNKFNVELKKLHQNVVIE